MDIIRTTKLGLGSLLTLRIASCTVINKQQSNLKSPEKIMHSSAAQSRTEITLQWIIRLQLKFLIKFSEQAC